MAEKKVVKKAEDNKPKLNEDGLVGGKVLTQDEYRKAMAKHLNKK